MRIPPVKQPVRPQDVIDRLSRWLQEDTPRPARGERSRAALTVAVVLFLGALVFGATKLPPIERGVRWWLLLAVPLVGVPLTVLVNSLEYAVTGRMAGTRPQMWDATRVAVLSSAANLLPIPGAVVVRARALRQLGSSYSRAISATAVVGLAWVGVTAVLVGLLQLPGHNVLLGAAVTFVGLLLVAIFVAMVDRSVERHDRARIVASVLAVEVAAVAVAALRYLLVLGGLGYDVGLPAATALTVAAVLASATGFFPGGLGLRELLVAGIGPIVHIPAAVSVVGTAVDRLAGLAMLAVFAALLIMGDKAKTAMEPTGDEGPTHGG